MADKNQNISALETILSLLSPEERKRALEKIYDVLRESQEADAKRREEEGKASRKIEGRPKII